MLTATMSLQFGLPGAVAVRHTIDPGRQLLTRIVSDVGGVLEHEEIDLAHACVSCAIREDIVPTLERLAAHDRWTGIVACLPVAAEAVQVCRVVCWTPRNAAHVKVAAVVAALDATTVADDLLGEDLLDERGLATSDDDRRGVGEVACAMVEYADVVSLTEAASEEEAALITALARPRVPVLDDPPLLDATALAAGGRRHEAVEAWVAKVRRGALPPLPDGGVWRLDLCSDRPLHPVRLHDELAILGHGPRRSRGCFWVPTRPDDVCGWDGVGGQVTIGSVDRWGRREPPLTRIVITGIDSAEELPEIEAAFGRCLLSDDELACRGRAWKDTWDGLEPWLGPISRVG